MTVIRPELQFGLARIDDRDKVEGFEEKPILDGWVNGGFFIFEPGAAEYLSEDSVLERQPLEALAAAGDLRAFRHPGFWKCMDTYKDRQALEDLLGSGPAPWGGWD
jgi:glucose-1-phosphate cytidylyltransferase